ncbi:MAG: Na(+)/H(+) antiporter subunit D [Candidatus Omnitrophica bacterium]|nr:Na(+)/H(+) antiporter subunit D [Candidatus Omnitrophota bacterium]
MRFLTVLPIALPMATAIVCLFLREHARAQRIACAAGATLHLSVAVTLLCRVHAKGIQVVQAGSWPAPHGISFVADLFSAIMVVLTGIIGLAVALYSVRSIDNARVSLGYYPLLQVLLMGVSGAFLTGDIFNMYVWFEVLLISSFVLLSLGGGKAQIEGAIKYVVLNLISSAFFVAAVAVLYGLTGTLNLADLSRVAESRALEGSLTLPAILFMFAFGIKAAIFPLYFWLPASYHTPPPAVAALFAGLLTKVGVYALVRVFTLVFVHDVGVTHGILLVSAMVTMVLGVLGAAAGRDVRRILSFHIISQVGYMVLGLALYTPLALAGTVFYIAHHILVKANLFLVGGLIQRAGGSYDLKRLGGLSSSHPWLAALFLIPALSLAGLPPLSGFYAKLTLLAAGLQSGEYLAVAVALVVGLLTLYSMIKIWQEAFWKPVPADAAAVTPGVTVHRVLPVAALALMTVLIGVCVGPLYALSREAGDQLMDRRAYVIAVLGEGR